MRSAARIAPEAAGDEHIWWLVGREEFKEATRGDFVDFVVEIEVQATGSTAPHEHPAHEWFYILSGDAHVSIGDDERDVETGDFVYIPPGEVHSLRSTGASPLRFIAMGFAPAGAD